MDLQFIGKFKIANPDGTLKVYGEGEIVEKEGKYYIAAFETSGFSPEHGEKRGWRLLNSSGVHTGGSAPYEPVVGQRWLNTTNGMLYEYIYDGNSYSWVGIL
jgi:hypothetical protein